MIAILLSLVLTQTAPDTGEIRGHVVDKETGRPVAGARVHVSGHDGGQVLGDAVMVTDETGAFRFTALKPGRYSGIVTASRHLVGGVAASPSGPLVVTKGATLNVTVALARAYAITFHVLDEFGDPLSAMHVALTSVGGPDSGDWRGSEVEQQSDDKGRVRISGVAPGRYKACVDPSPMGVDQSSVHAVSDRLVRTCYPSVSDQSQAEAITVMHGDLDGVEIRVRRGRTFSVGGTIVDASGAPAADATAFFGVYTARSSSSSTISLDPAGRFHVTNVQPGSYGISATRGGPQPGPFQESHPAEAAFVEVRVNDDIDNLSVMLRRTSDVKGRIVLEDPSAPFTRRPNYGPPLVWARLAEPGSSTIGGRLSASVREDRTFALPSVFGSRTLELDNIPPGWFVKTIRYAGKEAFEEPIEFKDADAVLEIVLSNHGATLTGTVADVVDKRLPRARVVLVSAPAGEARPARLAGSVMSATGTFNFGPLHDGDYVIVAVPPDTPSPRPDDPDAIARLAALGERVSLTELEQRTIELRVVTVR